MGEGLAIDGAFPDNTSLIPLPPESSMSTLNILMAQMNTLVGDFEGNTQKVIDAITLAEQTHDAPVVVCPELTLSGYPPEDLLLRPSIAQRVSQSLNTLHACHDRRSLCGDRLSTCTKTVFSTMLQESCTAEK